jgi:hypothetical protein
MECNRCYPAASVVDGGPGAGQQLPLVPGQAGVQAVHQAHHQGQHQVTSHPVACKGTVQREFLHLVPLRPLTVGWTF